MISFIGDYFVMLAVPIVVNRLTGSAMMVGLIYIAGAVPALALGPIAGVFIDRWDRRKVMIVSDLVRAGLVLVNLSVHSKEEIWIFYLTSFLMSCTSQFFFPSRNAVLPLIVDNEDDLLAANSLMQIIQTVGFLVGPALAGFAISLWGEAVAFIVNSARFVASALAVFTIHLIHTPRESIGQNSGVRAVFSELRVGLAYLLTNRTTVGVMVMLTVCQLGIGSFMVIWIPFLQRYFNQGAQGVGLIDSFFGAGMVLGGVLVGFLAARVSKTLLATVSMFIMGLLALPMGYAPTYTLILALNFFFGIALVPMQSALTTLLQIAVPDEKRGRVGSSLNASVTIGGLLSMGFAAFFSEMIGLRNMFIFVGALIAISGLVGFWLLKEGNETIPTVRLSDQT